MADSLGLEDCTILIAEDFAPQLDMLASYFELKGSEVLTAGDGVAALEVFTSDPDKFDAVIFDWLMPWIDGVEFFNAASQLRNELCYIMVSGSERDARIDDLLLNGLFAFLRKPVSGKKICATFEEYLARQNAPHAS